MFWEKTNYMELSKTNHVRFFSVNHVIWFCPTFFCILLKTKKTCAVFLALTCKTFPEERGEQHLEGDDLERDPRH